MIVRIDPVLSVYISLNDDSTCICNIVSIHAVKLQRISWVYHFVFFCEPAHRIRTHECECEKRKSKWKISMQSKTHCHYVSYKMFERSCRNMLRNCNTGAGYLQGSLYILVRSFCMALAKCVFLLEMWTNWWRFCMGGSLGGLLVDCSHACLLWISTLDIWTRTSAARTRMTKRKKKLCDNVLQDVIYLHKFVPLPKMYERTHTKNHVGKKLYSDKKTVIFPPILWISKRLLFAHIMKAQYFCLNYISLIPY